MLAGVAGPELSLLRVDQKLSLDTVREDFPLPGLSPMLGRFAEPILGGIISYMDLREMELSSRKNNLSVYHRRIHASALESKRDLARSRKVGGSRVTKVRENVSDMENRVGNSWRPFAVKTSMSITSCRLKYLDHMNQDESAAPPQPLHIEPLVLGQPHGGAGKGPSRDKVPRRHGPSLVLVLSSSGNFTFNAGENIQGSGTTNKEANTGILASEMDRRLAFD